MTPIERAPAAFQEMLEPLEDGRFQFACHPGVACFTECCRDLTLLMTPYDVLVLKTHLQLEADDFLDRYTNLRFDEPQRLPMVYLKMQADERKTCPFVSPEGCTVYQARPSACRTYPLARASRKHRFHNSVLEDYFVVRESHCRGFDQGRSWTVAEWIKDQGLEPFHEMNNLWMEIVTHPGLREGVSANQQQMFFLASYKLDQFRSFVFSSRFLSMFRLSAEEVEAVRAGDENLFRFACRWLRFSLLGEPTLELVPGAR